MNMRLILTVVIIPITIFVLVNTSKIFAQEKKTTNHVLITSPPVEGAKVYIDGAFKGQTGTDGACILRNVESGQHTVRVIKEGYREFSRQFNLKELMQTITASLTKDIKIPPTSIKRKEKKTPKIQHSWIFINTNEDNADVFFDGVRKGKTDVRGNFRVYTTPGEHTIEVRKKGFTKDRKIVKVKASLSESFTFTLVPGTTHLPGFAFFSIILIIIACAFIFVLMRRNISKGRVRFDRYIIHGVIGRGGMATIYKAKDTLTGQFIALKIMDLAFQSDPDLNRKFIREGWATSEINKDFPNSPVVKIFRYGRENNRSKGRPFIAMEFLHGQNLLSIIQSGRRLDIRFIHRVIEQVAEALKAAHKKGIYHRDVTPDNVIVFQNDPISPAVKLIDFGVARHEYTSIGTLDGSLSGKPPYMSPEQCRGEKVDGRSDIYSLGILFYTLLNGRPPFESKNPFDVMRNHEIAPVPPLKRNVPEGIKAVLFKMLKKDKKERYRSMSEVILNLKKLAVYV